jgi:hypothetical protein
MYRGQAAAYVDSVSLWSADCVPPGPDTQEAVVRDGEALEGELGTIPARQTVARSSIARGIGGVSWQCGGISGPYRWLRSHGWLGASIPYPRSWPGVSLPSH